MSKIELQKNDKKITSRNYFIVLMVAVLTITIVLYARKFINDYNENINNISILEDNTQSINISDLNYIIPETKEAIIYVSYKGNKEINSMEKKLYNKIKNTEIKEKIMYLDVSNYIEDSRYISVLRDKFKNIENEINTAPIFIYIKDGKAIEAASSELKIVDYNVLKELEQKYKEE